MGSFPWDNYSHVGTGRPKRGAPPATYSAKSSEQIHLRPAISAARAVVIQPAQGSTTRPPGGHNQFTRNRASASGIGAPCAGSPAALAACRANQSPFGLRPEAATADPVGTVRIACLPLLTSCPHESKVPFAVRLKHAAVVRCDRARVVREPVDRLPRRPELHAVHAGPLKRPGRLGARRPRPARRWRRVAAGRTRRRA